MKPEVAKLEAQKAAGAEIKAMADRVMELSKLGHRAPLEDAAYELRKVAGFWSGITMEQANSVLSGQTQTDSLVGALKRFMTTRTGVRLSIVDLREIVLDLCDKDHKAHWARRRGEQMGGLLRFDTGAHAALAAAGLLCWQPDADSHFRIVRKDWLKKREDIFAHVTAERPRGNLCRFCLMVEPGESLELIEAGTADRSVSTVNGVVQRNTKVVTTHAPCEPLWLAWVAISEGMPAPGPKQLPGKAPADRRSGAA